MVALMAMHSYCPSLRLQIVGCMDFGISIGRTDSRESVFEPATVNGFANWAARASTAADTDPMEYSSAESHTGRRLSALPKSAALTPAPPPLATRMGCVPSRFSR